MQQQQDGTFLFVHITDQELIDFQWGNVLRRPVSTRLAFNEGCPETGKSGLGAKSPPISPTAGPTEAVWGGHGGERDG